MKYFWILILSLFSAVAALPDCSEQSWTGLLSSGGKCPDIAQSAIDCNTYNCFTIATPPEDTTCTCEQVFNALVYGWLYEVSAICNNAVWQGGVGQGFSNLCPQCITDTCDPTCEVVKGEIVNDNNYDHCPPILSNNI